MAATQRYRGTVKTGCLFGRAGIILMPDGREVLMRYSSIRGEGIRVLRTGSTVTFQIEETRRGLYAACVQEE